MTSNYLVEVRIEKQQIEKNKNWILDVLYS